MLLAWLNYLLNLFKIKHTEKSCTDLCFLLPQILSFFFQIQVNGLMKMITCSRRCSTVLLVIFQKKNMDFSRINFFVKINFLETCKPWKILWMIICLFTNFSLVVLLKFLFIKKYYFLYDVFLSARCNNVIIIKPLSFMCLNF